MDCELVHMLRTYSDHEVISEQGGLRDLLSCLRSLAEELQLDFGKALTESVAAPGSVARFAGWGPYESAML
jgi:hypothetical protein